MHLRPKRDFTVLCSNILVWEWKKGGSINSKSWIFWRIEFTNWKLVATWLAHSKHFLALKVQLKGFESALIKKHPVGRFPTSGKILFQEVFTEYLPKKRKHFPNFSLVDNFINHNFCDEGETDFFGSGLVRFESGLGEGLEESVYFCACHLGWEGVITV